MDIVAIQEAIEDLEKANTTVDNVTELASLYIVKEHISDGLKTMVEREYDDILPAYREYCNIKRKYQLHEVTEGAVIKQLQLCCDEIEEFLLIIYSHTDMRRERKIIEEMLRRIYQKYNQ